jgi:ADP-ribosylglycohydrolase
MPFKVAIDLTGRKVGKLVVLARAGKNKWGHQLWECECECGARYVTSATHLATEKVKSCGCQLRASARARRGEKHPRWKGGRREDKNGYITIRCYDYPGATGSVSVYEHQAVMAKHLGRPIMIDESIHHRNGIRNDNRLENLELRVSYHGQGQTIDDAIALAQSILRRYAPHTLVC